MDILQAARKLMPGTAWTLRGDVLEQAEDGTPRVGVPSESDLQALIDADAYKDLRRAAYPPLADLADAIVHQANGDDSLMTAYIAACNAVKAQYPKPD